MIAKETVDKVFDASRVEEVIGDFVQLKKSGSNYKGLSPFTEERTPSFMVSPVKQIWKDFSSGKGGNVVAFLMEHEHFTYPEAIKYLAKKYGIEVEETQQSDEAKEQANERESMYLVSEFAQKNFQHNLLETGKGKAIGLSYFKERGFTTDTIEKFKLGYSLDEWSAFTDDALKEGYQLEFLQKTGLTIVKEERRFDRFKGRVMFPIHSMSGRVLGFGGRILTNDKKAAKYLNSPESDIYHKSKVLYGIYHAKQAIAKEDNCYLVEGYTDVIQFHQSGIENVVASSGTALTPDQIRLVNRLTKNITVLFDGDAAGLRASVRGIDLILEQGMNVKVCTFPEGDDPDSFARKNSLEDIKAYLQENAKDFIQFKASMLMQEAKNDPIKKAETIRDIVTSISKIPDRIQKEVYLQECSRIMDISEDVLFNSLAQLDKKEIKEADKHYKQERKQQSQSFDVVKNAEQPREQINIIQNFEREIIRFLVIYGAQEISFKDLVLDEENAGEEADAEKTMKVYEKLFLDIQQDEIEFSNPIFQEIFTLSIEEFLEKSELKLSTLVNNENLQLSNVIAEIVSYHDKYSLSDWARKDVFPEGNDKIKSEDVLKVIGNYRIFLITKLIGELMSSEQMSPELLVDIQLYSQLKNKISNRYGLLTLNLGFSNYIHKKR
ncbi:DNA primase [Pustulibacterium marinum]|uniref:DNA primase n=1 Tax=Pustulibacterium marinum TaxID=1224947 RepID=A0A1I7GMH5_9FLAO|nr:DNA primase [Pustulibacterium marinum]SFU49635.1 DNA primase [Pustulibacterium marinum]